MKWGSAFADLCFKEQVKLVNYPVGVQAIGPPGGLQGTSNFPLKHMKAIVKSHIDFWQQEAREMKAEASKGDAPGLSDDDEVVFEDDLVKFIPWNEGMLPFRRL